jgi:2-polyprenyl-3-methyl-5-hydroxy-6-metoxy-1,4-benzoquinol methylase
MDHFDKFARKFRANHHDFLVTIEAFWECLRRQRAALGDQWPEFTRAFRKRELHSFLLQDPLTNRAFVKPRGYAGDALMLDFIYGHNHVRDLMVRSSEAGLRLLAYTAGGCPAARAVRWRCARAAQEIEAAAIRRTRARVLSVACGHMRELELVHPELRRRLEVTATDADGQSLETVMHTHRSGCVLECRRVSVRDLILNTHGLTRGYDLVYALGLFDYLNDKVAARLVPVLWSLVAPEGKLMFANFTPETKDAPYIEAATDWWLQYRSSEALEASTALVANQTIATRESFKDPFGQVAYLCMEKR